MIPNEETFIRHVMDKAGFNFDNVSITGYEYGRRIYLSINDKEYCIRTWNITKEYIDYTLFLLRKTDGIPVIRGRYIMQ